MQALRGKSNGKVPPVLASFYAQWRVRCGVVPVLRDDQDSPPERLLQTIWQHQRLLREQLKTLDGNRSVSFIPVSAASKAAPISAAPSSSSATARRQTGDIEVDLRSSGWRAHGHDRNPAFQNVILHVVWESEKPASGAPPTLPLRAVLDSPLGELSLWLGGEAAQTLPEELRGDCCAPLRTLPAAQLLDLLHQSAHVRLQSKAAQFQARARRVGWEQALWEGLCRALGFKHNVWPMQRLAELRPRWHTPRTQPLALQARLFGISGLLPLELTRSRDRRRQLRPPRLGPMVARARRILRLPPAARALASARLAARQSPAAPHRPCVALVDGAATWRTKLERWCAREVPDSALAEFAARSPAGRAR